MILDTGASRTTLDPSALHHLGLPLRRFWIPRPHWRIGDFRWDTRYASPDRLAIGEAEIRGLEVREGEFNLLGADVLGRCALLVDVENRKLHLLPSEGLERILAALYPGTTWVHTPLRGGQRTTLEIAGGRRLDMVVDTGAQLTGLNRKSVQALGLKQASPNALRRQLGLPEPEGDPPFRLNAFRGQPGVEAGVYRLEGLVIGGEPRTFLVNEVEGPIPNILGMDQLGRSPFILDGPGERLWIARLPAAPVAP